MEIKALSPAHFYIVAKRRIYSDYAQQAKAFDDTATRDGAFNITVNPPEVEPEIFFKSNRGLTIYNPRAAILIFMNGLLENPDFQKVQDFIFGEYFELIEQDAARIREPRIILYIMEEFDKPHLRAQFTERMEAVFEDQIRDGFIIASAYPTTVAQALFRILDSINKAVPT